MTQGTLNSSLESFINVIFINNSKKSKLHFLTSEVPGYHLRLMVALGVKVPTVDLGRSALPTRASQQGTEQRHAAVFLLGRGLP